jgi:hypothetical protein
MTKPLINLQDLRRRMYAKAKAEPTWRFWGLFVHVCKMETLREAYALAKKNGGAPGIDGVTFEAIEEGGVESYLEQIRDELVSRRYVPMPNRKKEIPKDGGKKVRVLSIPSIRDRVVQGAMQLILEPIFGAARNGVDHAGESPAAVIARFGCVAIPGGMDRRLSRPKAQVNVLGAERSDPTGGLANSGAVAVANTTASIGSPRGNWVAWYLSGLSPSKMGDGQ